MHALPQESDTDALSAFLKDHPPEVIAIKESVLTELPAPAEMRAYRDSRLPQLLFLHTPDGDGCFVLQTLDGQFIGLGTWVYSEAILEDCEMVSAAQARLEALRLLGERPRAEGLLLDFDEARIVLKALLEVIRLQYPDGDTCCPGFMSLTRRVRNYCNFSSNDKE